MHEPLANSVSCKLPNAICSYRPVALRIYVVNLCKARIVISCSCSVIVALLGWWIRSHKHQRSHLNYILNFARWRPHKGLISPVIQLCDLSWRRSSFNCLPLTLSASTEQCKWSSNLTQIHWRRECNHLQWIQRRQQQIECNAAKGIELYDCSPTGSLRLQSMVRTSLLMARQLAFGIDQSSLLRQITIKN